MNEQLQDMLDQIRRLQDVLGLDPADRSGETPSPDTTLGHNDAARLTQAKAQLRELEGQLAQQSAGARPPTDSAQPDA